MVNCLSFMLFLGAGASAQFKIPLFEEMAKKFQRETLYSKHGSRIQRIKKALKRVGFRPNIENYISYARGRLTPRQTLLRMNPFVCHYVASSNTKKLGYDSSAKQFIVDLEEYVYDNLFIHEYVTIRNVISHYDNFFRFLNRRFCKNRDFRKFEVDIFTTNYDNTIEEFAEESGFTVFDGFMEMSDGISYFMPENYRKKTDPFRLYKMHGSVRLGIVEDSLTRKRASIHSKRKIKIGDPYQENWTLAERIMLLGYDKDISREPYFELLNLLKEKLASVNYCVVVGFSFYDRPILNIFRDVLKQREEKLEIILLGTNASKIKDTKFNNDNRVRDLNHDFSNFTDI